METPTLNTPEEIALWTAACAEISARGLTSATDAARCADRLLLEFRARIPAASTSPITTCDLDEQLRIAAAQGQRVRVSMADGDSVEGIVEWEDPIDAMPACVNGRWCGKHEPNPTHRVTRVEILDA